MKSKRFILPGALLVLLVLFSLPVGATDDIGAPLIKQGETVVISDYINQMKGENYTALLADAETPKSLDMRETKQNNEKANHKSPLKAFAYSLVIPGTGQLYTGSKTKALLFAGLEALGWTGHIIYHGKGDDNTDIYEAFADENWFEQRYTDWLEKHWDVTDDELAIGDNDLPVFGHNLPDTKTQQYYEMIGKYNQFVYGWVDTDLSSSTGAAHPDSSEAYSPKRIHYEGLRNDANKMYDRATTALVVVMANHVISAIEAALAARSHNNNSATMAQRVSFKAYAARSEKEYFPMFKMTYKF